MTNRHSADAFRPLDAEWLASVLESLPDALIITTLTGEVVYLNTAAKRLLGTGLNEARGRPLAECLTLLDGTTRTPVSAPLTRFLARSNSLPRDDGAYDLVRQRDGTEVPVEDHCTVLRGRHGEAAGLVLVLRDATSLRALVHAASHDPLTCLVNRAEFERRLQRLLARMRPGEAHALLYIDLDHFKAINDSHGHAAGDSVLRQVAECFAAMVRERDTLARLGGDEFVVLLEHCPLEYALAQARRMQEAIETRRFAWQDQSFQLGISIGVVPITPTQRDPSAVLTAADRACYAAKRHSLGTAASTALIPPLPGAGAHNCYSA